MELSSSAGTGCFRELPDFHLTDQSGNAFSRDDLTGKVWVADFIFTTCAGPCPIMSSQFTELQDRFSHLPDFRLLSISVNPEYDTPQVLKDTAIITMRTTAGGRS